MTTFDRIKEIIVNQLGVDDADITMETRINTDLGADSLDDVEMVMEIEEVFDIEIPDDDLWDKRDSCTVGDVVAYVDGRLQK